jgi:hypothetical protein
MKSLQSVFIKTTCMLLLASSLNSLTSVQAQVTQSTVASTDSSGSIRFLRAEGDMLVFELLLINLPENGSQIRILDGDNNTLLEERISTKTYNIRYKITRGDMNKINFEVSDNKILLNQSFTIKSRTEEKIEVTKV